MSAVLEVRTVVVQTGPGKDDTKPAYRHCVTFCPGCQMIHAFTIEVFDGYTGRGEGKPEPVWQWDGNEESPTFSPSMLAYYSVHLCPGDYVHHEVCTDPECDAKGHLILNEDWETTDERVLGHNLPHVVDPAWGNCHSFLKNGQWEFLGDSAHALADQTVPMVPLPGWVRKSNGC